MNRRSVLTKFHWPLAKFITPFRAWVVVLGLVLALGLWAALVVFARGLVVTHLSDLVPWGLWITVDLSSIAMSAGAFTLCAAVYLLGLKQFQPIARTATFIGLIGYSMAVLCLMLDIGRPDRFWHALVFWNPHSVLWEVTMCVTLYLSVLVLEATPLLGQADWFQRRWPGLARRLVHLHQLAPFLAIVGLGLSLLHQSSLGATYGILKSRPIWYRPDLSVLFTASAVAGGVSLTLLASMVVARLNARIKINDHLLERLSFFIGWVLVVYLYVRFWDAFSMTYTYLPGRTEGLDMLTRGQLSFNFWVGEILLGAILPIILLLARRLRQIPWVRMVALAMVVGGVVAYRWDTNMVGQLVSLTYLPQDITARYTTYIPSLIEFLTAAGIVAYGLLAFTLGVRYLNVVDHQVMPEPTAAVIPEAMPAPAAH
jgi:Ni/Fe-hydrogenase subunit HybB-like protein